MSKRKWVALEELSEDQLKRRRRDHLDRLSNLSDEVVLRTLSFLPVESLATCQGLSHRLYTLAGDSQLWKSAYYNRFVRPRAARIPGIREAGVSGASLFYSSRISRWLEDEHLVRKGRATDWKRQYKLRHNWARGSCDVQEIQIAERPSLPPMLVRLHDDVVITADDTHGLRAWTTKGSQRLLASLAFFPKQEQKLQQTAPTSLAIDATRNSTYVSRIVVGFQDGRFAIYIFNQQEECFKQQYMRAASTNGMISAVAYAWPYIVTMTEAQLLSLYCFGSSVREDSVKDPPRLLTSLKSHTAWPPLSLSLRMSSNNVIASIAYALPTYLSGWSVGLQELRITMDGAILQSRLTSAANQGFTPLFAVSGTSTPDSEVDSMPSGTSERRQLPSSTKPTSLSYSHPYLLASHPDNTLTLYLVQSTEIDLIIESGSRLWGHTSSVSGAHVGDRGKAVSVSAHGDEIRVWELEGGLRSMSSKRRAATGESSVQIRPEKSTSTADPQGHAMSMGYSTALLGSLDFRDESLSTTKGWVGFDEEKVVVLREKGRGSQALVVYDFS